MSDRALLQRLNQIYWTRDLVDRTKKFMSGDLEVQPVEIRHLSVQDIEGIKRWTGKELIAHDARESVIKAEAMKADCYGRDKLYNVIKDKYIGITRNDVAAWVKNNKPPRKTRLGPLQLRNAQRHRAARKGKRGFFKSGR